MDLFTVDWAKLFTPTESLAEIFVRGTITYIGLFTVMRFFLKRQTGVIGIADLLIVVMIADAAQNAMAGEYQSITEGALLVCTVSFWNFALDWIGFHVPWFQRFLRAPPLLLIKDGQYLYQNMRKEMITKEELESQLRQQGCGGVDSVTAAYIEGDGRISVITCDSEGGGNNQPERRI